MPMSMCDIDYINLEWPNKVLLLSPGRGTLTYHQWSTLGHCGLREVTRPRLQYGEAPDDLSKSPSRHNDPTTLAVMDRGSPPFGRAQGG